MNYTTGLAKLDENIKIDKGDFVVIATKPGVGKTMFMLQQAIENAKLGVKTLFISFEMDKESIKARILNNFSSTYIQGQFTDEFKVLDVEGFKKYIEALENNETYKLMSGNLRIDVAETSSADFLIRNIEYQIKENGYEAIFIDYLQLARYIGIDDWESLRKLTVALKDIAFQNNVLIVAGSQISVPFTKGDLRIPSSFIGMAVADTADTVIEIAEDEENKRDRTKGEKSFVNIKVIKNREGNGAELSCLIDYSCGKITCETLK